MKESTNRFPSPLTMKMNTSIATPHCQTESSNPKLASDGLTVNSQFLKSTHINTMYLPEDQTLLFETLNLQGQSQPPAQVPSKKPLFII